MRDDVGHGLEALDRTGRRPGRVEDESLADRPRGGPAEAAERVHEPHGLGQAGCFTFEDGPGAFGREVAGPEAGAAGGDDEAGEPGAQGLQGGGHRLGAVAHHLPVDDLEAGPFQRLCEGCAGAVLAGAGHHAVRHREHLGLRHEPGR